MIKIIDKKDIVNEVEKEVRKAKKEILASMLLSEEVKNPLPVSYRNLLAKRIDKGVVLKRIGFGTREEYVKISKQYRIESQKYFFRLEKDPSIYQRLLIIDRRKLFFKIDKTFFESDNQQLIDIFLDYFLKRFKKGK